jgi:hypothetical protein
MKKFLISLTILIFFAGCSDDGRVKSDLEESVDDAIYEGSDDIADDDPVDSENDEDSTEKFSFDIQRVYDDVAWLAHADRTGRQPGTQGNADSVEYVRALFDELGLMPAGDGETYLQSFSFDQWVITGTPEAEIDGALLSTETGFQVIQYSGGGDVSAEVVFAGHGITVPPFKKSEYPDCPLPETGYDDFADVDVTGKIALVIRPGPGNLESVHNGCPANDACVTAPCLWNFGYKSKNASIHGAVGVIVVNHYQESGEVPVGMTLGGEYFVEDLPVIFADRGYNRRGNTGHEIVVRIN